MKNEQKQQFYFFLILNELQDFQNLNKTLTKPQGVFKIQKTQNLNITSWGFLARVTTSIYR